ERRSDGEITYRDLLRRQAGRMRRAIETGAAYLPYNPRGGTAAGGSAALADGATGVSSQDFAGSGAAADGSVGVGASGSAGAHGPAGGQDAVGRVGPWALEDG